MQNVEKENATKSPSTTKISTVLAFAGRTAVNIGRQMGQSNQLNLDNVLQIRCNWLMGSVRVKAQGSLTSIEGSLIERHSHKVNGTPVDGNCGCRTWDSQIMNDKSTDTDTGR